MQSLIIAFSMYSKIPMPRVEWNKKNMKYSLCYFPLVGLVIGLIVYAIGQIGFYYQWNQLLFASIMTIIPVVITGGIHFDGLLDTMDALSAYCSMEKRLEILKDSNSGAFAIIGGLVYFVFSLGIWSSVPKEALKIILLIYPISRTLGAFSIVAFPLSKNTGLAATFQEGADKKIVKIIMVILYIVEIGIMIYLNVLIGISCILVSKLFFVYHFYVSKKYFGGVSGDLVGYFLQICEIGMLTAATIVGNIIL